MQWWVKLLEPYHESGWQRLRTCTHTKSYWFPYILTQTYIILTLCGVSRKSTCITEVWAELAAFLFNTISTWKNEWWANYSYSDWSIWCTFSSNEQSEPVTGNVITMINFSELRVISSKNQIFLKLELDIFPTLSTFSYETGDISKYNFWYCIIKKIIHG